MGKAENKMGTNDEWCTPPEVYEPIIECLGPIGLDPFGSPDQAVPAKTILLLDDYKHEVNSEHEYWEHFCIVTRDNWEDNSWDYHGLVFANGPFSVLEKVLSKGAAQGDEVINLCPIRSGNRYWFHHVWQIVDGLIFLPRVTFLGADSTAPMHLVLTYRGDRVEEFAKIAPLVGGQFFLME
jgi:hypothetical protein